MSTFTTEQRANAPLITSAAIAADQFACLRLAPAGLKIPDGANAFQIGALYELNRFPGDPVLEFAPAGEHRDATIAEAERRAQVYEENTGRLLQYPLPVPGYFTVDVYVKNLRELFLCADLQDGRPPHPGNGPMMLDIPSTLEFLTKPANAIKFALERLEAFEVPQFLRDWQQGHCLRGWLESLNETREDALDAYRMNVETIA